MYYCPSASYFCNRIYDYKIQNVVVICNTNHWQFIRFSEYHFTFVKKVAVNFAPIKETNI
jgi:hypothetical protein